MAATIHVHVGQCGNQLGERFWSLAAASSATTTTAKNNNGGGSGLGEQQPQEQGEPGSGGAVIARDRLT